MAEVTAPKLHRIDHVHLYAPDREAVVTWYRAILGFAIVKELTLWAEDTRGPLTIEDASGMIHLAIFQSDVKKPFSLAFGVSGGEYLKWRSYLEQKHLLARERDHTLSWSLYFDDPFGNGLEITTYDYAEVSAAA